MTGLPYHMNIPEIEKFFKGRSGKFVAPRLKWDYIAHTCPKLFHIMKSYFDDIEPVHSPAEVLYRIIHNIVRRPVCPVCGTPVGFRRLTGKDAGYDTCCPDCKESGKFRKVATEHAIETNLRRYGYRTPAERPDVKQRIEDTVTKKYGGFAERNVISDDRRRMTCIERYGTDNPIQSESIKAKVRDTLVRKYGSMENYRYQSGKAFRRTCIMKYGVEYPSENPVIRKKMNNTCIERYGGASPMSSKDVVSKAMETKHVNKTFNTSRSETGTYEKLRILYPDIIKEYTDRRYSSGSGYMYRCDLFIPEYDLFIELNGFPSHGPHPYSDGSPSDKSLLEYWTVHNLPWHWIWTSKDVEKRNTALYNHLNYIEIFSTKTDFIIRSITDYIDNLGSGYACSVDPRRISSFRKGLNYLIDK